MLFDSLQLSGVLLGNVYLSLQLAVAWRRNSFRSRWAVPRMVDNWTLPRRSGTFCLTNQVFAPFDMLKRAPITIGIIMTSEAPWTLLISNASSWYFSTFSSVLMMYWPAGTAMSISVHFFAFMHKGNIYPIMLQHFVCMSQVILTSPFSAIGQGSWLYHLWVQLYPILPAHLPVYPQGHPVVTFPYDTLSG